MYESEDIFQKMNLILTRSILIDLFAISFFHIIEQLYQLICGMDFEDMKLP